MTRNGAQMNEAEENVNARLCSKNKLARLAVSHNEPPPPDK